MLYVAMVIVKYNFLTVSVIFGVLFFSVLSGVAYASVSTTEIIDTAGDGGNTLDAPFAIATDSSGNVYVVGADSDNAFQITPAGVITEIINAGGDGVNALNSPFAIATDSSGNVYVVGTFSHNAFQITPAGVITEIINAGGDGVNALSAPFGIATDSSGNVYVVGNNSHNVFQITPAGVITEIINAGGDGVNALSNPIAITIDSSGNVYVAGSVSNNVFQITPAGVITEIINAGGDGTGNTLSDAFSIVTDSSGNVYVAGSVSNNVFQITPAGVITKIIDDVGITLNIPRSVMVDSSDNVYVAGAASDNVFKLVLVDNTDDSGSSDDKRGGSGCTNCTPPTLGFNEDGVRLVENGFTYNGNPTDVELYFTPYPLITANVGHPNIATFKIFDDGGVDAISHFEMAFGLAKGEIISESKARIEWDRSFDGNETVTIFDPSNVLDNVNVTHTVTKCSPSDVESKCLMLNIEHMFRAPLDFDIVATNVWDIKRNAWQNYYNHGIHVEGDSLNPPETVVGIHYDGYLVHLIKTSKNTAVDIDGNMWSFDKKWTMDYSPIVRSDPDTSVMTRNHSMFEEYILFEEEKSLLIMNSLCSSCSESYVELNDTFQYDFSAPIGKSNNPILQDAMYAEMERAQQILDTNNEYISIVED